MTAPETAISKGSAWLAWWSRLQEDRGGRAELARCGTVRDAAFCAPFHLLRWMNGNPTDDFELKKIGLIAAVLSHVNAHDPNCGSLAHQMAEGDKAIVSDSRFRQLLRSESGDFDDRLVAMVRVLRQLGRKVDVERLAKDLWWWNEKTKRAWALEYYEQRTVVDEI